MILSEDILWTPFTVLVEVVGGFLASISTQRSRLQVTIVFAALFVAKAPFQSQTLHPRSAWSFRVLQSRRSGTELLVRFRWFRSPLGCKLGTRLLSAYVVDS